MKASAFPGHTYRFSDTVVIVKGDEGVFFDFFRINNHYDKSIHHIGYQGTCLMLYSFPFTGKEIDSETGLYYFGARYYAPALSGLFISVDPMADKYPNLSPYAYCAWNPVTLVDPDGQDGVKIINSLNKTITIKATYYVTTIPIPGMPHTSYSDNEVFEMQQEINHILNEAKYTYDIDGDSYNVIFKLNFVPSGESYSAENASNNDLIGNTFSVMPSEIIEKVFSSENEAVGGVTAFNKYITMNERYDSNRNRIHEIFHTLYYNNDDADEGIGNYYPGVDLPSSDDIKRLIDNSQLPSIDE